MGRGLGSHLDPGDTDRNLGNGPKYKPMNRPSSLHRQRHTKKEAPVHGDIDVKAFSHGLPRSPGPFSSPAAVVSSLVQPGEPGELCR